MVKFIDLKQQYDSIKMEIDSAIAQVIGESAFIGGKASEDFERRFADYQSAKYCIGVGNGTDAVEIALEALALPAGSEVLVPANSFIATSEAVTRSGFKVRFCAWNPDTYTLDVEDARAKVTASTRAIIVVHLYGQPCDMDAVLALANEHGLKVVEDCAQAHGAEYRGRRVGALGDIGAFSFYPGKNLGGYGDGGAIVTNDEALAKRCRMIANHGRIEKYNHEFEGRNSRLDNLQAAILGVKLNYLEDWNRTRIAVADAYDELLSGVGDVVIPMRTSHVRHVYHLYVIRTAQRDALQKHLKDCGIQSGIHYPIALPRLNAYAYLNQQTVRDGLHDQLLSLPMGEHMSMDAVKQVASAVKQFFALGGQT